MSDTSVIKQRTKRVRQLINAAKRGDMKLLALQIVRGADINGETPRQMSRALHKAAQFGQTEAIRALLAHGADVNGTNSDGVTALMEACRYHKEAAISVLLEAGASPNPEDNHGETALLTAVRMGNVKICSTLLAHGATIDLQSSAGSLPLSVAASCGHKEILQLLLNKYAKPDDRRVHASLALVHCKNKRNALLLLNAGADVNTISPYGWTPLITASHRGDLHLVRLYLLYRANVNVRDKWGYTALSRVRGSLAPRIVELLKSRGAVE